MVVFLSPPRVLVRSYVRRSPRKTLCSGGSSETLRLISVRGRRRRRHETASQSSGSEFIFADLESFGRRQRAHKGWRFHVLLLHQIWFHLSAPWWKVIRGDSDLEQREISTSLQRWGFVESVRLYPANWGCEKTPWMADLKVSVVDLCRAWTSPPEILRNWIKAPSVFTGGGDSLPLCLLTFNLSLSFLLRLGINVLFVFCNLTLLFCRGCNCFDALWGW